jgi:hypothetical protein
MNKQELTDLKNAIKSLTKWESSGKAFGYIESIDKPSTNYIYEFYCAMRILEDLSEKQSIQIEAGTEGFVFPRKPGNKGNWAKFLILKKETNEKLFQFCLGSEIKISTSHKTTFGADISLQKADSPNDPNESHVIWIMDAKYKKSKESKLDISTIREFAQCVSDMETPKDISPNLQLNKLSKLNYNCLLTNGECIPEHEQYCINNKLKQVGNFDCNGGDMRVIG